MEAEVCVLSLEKILRKGRRFTENSSQLSKSCPADLVKSVHVLKGVEMTSHRDRIQNGVTRDPFFGSRYSGSSTSVRNTGNREEPRACRAIKNFIVRAFAT